MVLLWLHFQLQKCKIRRSNVSCLKMNSKCANFKLLSSVTRLCKRCFITTDKVLDFLKDSYIITEKFLILLSAILAHDSMMQFLFPVKKMMRVRPSQIFLANISVHSFSFST